MRLRVTPGSELVGSVSMPGDKSLSHRAALFSALAVGESRIDNFQDSGVTRAMLSALKEFGIEWALNGKSLQVKGKGWDHFETPRMDLNCGNSATTLRLLAGAAAASGVRVVLDGSEGLRRRPMGRILEPLSRMGVAITGSTGYTAPLRLADRPAGQRLHGIEYRLPVASAQVKTCLLLAGLAADKPVMIHEPSPSRDHTERMLSEMGCRLELSSRAAANQHSILLYPLSQPLMPLRIRLPGDLSSAAFLIVAALIVPGSSIIVENVGLNPSRTGILDALMAMGANITVGYKGMEAGEPYGDLSIKASQLHGTKISGDLVVRMIDEFPVFAVAACWAHGTTEVEDAAELRSKESDRISTICQGLKLLGAEITETTDGFRVHGPCQVIGGEAASHGDHRLAMALIVAGAAAKSSIEVNGTEIIAESFPEFISVIRALGVNVEEEPGDAS